MMAQMTVLLLMIALCALNNGAAQIIDDPCLSNAISIINDPGGFRDPLRSGQPNLCDFSLTGDWYRVYSPVGDAMPTTCVQANRCGAQFPVWLNGTLPDEPMGVVSRMACVTFDDNCCMDSEVIKIRRCPGFYLYKLPAVRFCVAAYCFGTVNSSIAEVGEAIPRTRSSLTESGQTSWTPRLNPTSTWTTKQSARPYTLEVPSKVIGDQTDNPRTYRRSGDKIAQAIIIAFGCLAVVLSILVTGLIVYCSRRRRKWDIEKVPGNGPAPRLHEQTVSKSNVVELIKW